MIIMYDSKNLENNKLPELVINCNCLFPTENIREIISSKPIYKPIKKIGNWVGGKLSCYENEILFFANLLNKHNQKQNYLIIPYFEIYDVSFGQALIFFKTVDLSTNIGFWRFRCWGKSNYLLHDFLLPKIENNLQLLQYPIDL